MRHRSRLLLLAALALPMSGPAAAQSFEVLGGYRTDTKEYANIASISGGDYSLKRPVSADGRVVYGAILDPVTGFHAVILVGDSIRVVAPGRWRLDYPGRPDNVTTYMGGLSADGSTILGIDWLGGDLQSFVVWKWRTGEVARFAIPSSYGGPNALERTWISSDGSVVGAFFEWWDGETTRYAAVRYVDRVFDREFVDFWAYTMSDDGTTFGGIDSRTIYPQAAVATDAGVTAVEPPDAITANVHGLSPDGRIAVGRASFAEENYGYIWKDGEATIVPNIFSSEDYENYGGLFFVTRDGTIAVGTEQSSRSARSPVLWREGAGTKKLSDALREDYGLDLLGFDDNDPTRSTDFDVQHMTADGVIFGDGHLEGVRFPVWRAVLFPVGEDIVVTTTGNEQNDPDSADLSECDVDRTEDGLQCTLRAAIELANARSGATITFDIPGGGVPRIELLEERLPEITTPVVLDGTTQPGGLVEVVGVWPEGERPCGYVAPPPTPPAGFVLAAGAGGSTVRGLVLHGHYPSAITLLEGADRVTIEGNRIGTDPTGTIAMGNGCNHPHKGRGVHVEGSDGNRIVGNLISGNVVDADLYDGAPEGCLRGAEVTLSNSSGNVVEGNRIGTDLSGRSILTPPLPTCDPLGDAPPWVGGIFLYGGGEDNRIGGGAGSGAAESCTGPCNVVAGHGFEVGITWYLLYDSGGYSGFQNNVVAGNFIGVGVGGERLLWRDEQGEFPGDRGGLGLIGGGALIAGNRVSGGVTAVDHNRVEDNAFLSEQGINISGDGVHVEGNVVTFAPFSPADPCVGALCPWGIRLFSTTGSYVGGNTIRGGFTDGIYVEPYDVADTLVESNDIAGSAGAGVGFEVGEPLPREATSGVRLRHNRLSGNGIGIDIGRDGVTLNDLLDSDSGPNNLQNFPNILAVSYSDGGVRLEGFFETPLTSTATYTVEAFSSAACASGPQARWSVWDYGEGEHSLGAGEAAASLGDAAFALAFGSIPEGHHYVTATATGPDGSTSEFSRCVRAADADQTASADVEVGQTGELLAAQDAVVEASEVAALRAPALRTDLSAGTLYLTRYETAPDTSLFGEATATAPDGSSVRPTAIAPAYWWLADRHLTPEGGADEAARAFRVCLRPGDRVLDPSRVVLVQRNDATEGAWTPHDTEAVDRAGEGYLCAGGLTGLGEFSLGGPEDAFPVSSEEEPVGDASRPALALSVFPNPARSTATVPVVLPEAAHVRLAVLDVLGREVALVLDASQPAGRHDVALDTAGLPAGIYVLHLQADGSVLTRRFTVAR